MTTDAQGATAGRGRFATTRWSVVLQAGQDGDEAEAALETLCRTYWRPLYAYARGRGYAAADAEDLTQAFLAQLLARGGLARADPGRGRFRSYLLAGMRHFLADEWDKARARKRGGGRVFAMDFQGAETWLQALACPDLTPEEEFEKRWALTLLEEVYRRLEAQYRERGKAGLFDTLKVALAGPSEAAPTAALAASLDMSEGAVRVAVHRLRRDYRAALREAIADLVEDPGEVDDELRHLQNVVQRG